MCVGGRLGTPLYVCDFSATYHRPSGHALSMSAAQLFNTGKRRSRRETTNDTSELVVAQRDLLDVTVLRSPSRGGRAARRTDDRG
jgi:hypothetical protein